MNCGCKVQKEKVGSLAGVSWIIFCPLHAAAEEMLRCCKAAIGAFERNDAIDWNIFSEVIAKVEGK